MERMPSSRTLIIGFIGFAAFLMMLGGVFQALMGLAAIFDDSFYVATDNYFLEFDVTTWGWIHLVVGIVVAAAGVGLFTGAVWARSVAVVIAALSGIANFGFIPYYPVWSIAVIALDVAAIWVLTVHGREIANLE